MACRAQVRTGLGKSDRPGSQGGFENRDQLRRWRAGARAQFRARQPHARIDGRELETESRSGHGHRDEQPYGKPCGSNGSATYRRSRPPRQFPTLHRMSSGSYFPPPVRAVEIPKPHGGGTRVLGVPNVADRVAQTVVAGIGAGSGEGLSRRLLRISSGTVTVGRGSGMPPALLEERLGCAGINRLGGGDGKALRRRSSDPRRP